MESPTFGVRAPEWPTEHWDAAFLDLSADAALGLEMVRRARAATPLRRIAVIDEGGQDDAFARLARALSYGASEFLSKPIGIPEAGGVLERLGL